MEFCDFGENWTSIPNWFYNLLQNTHSFCQDQPYLQLRVNPKVFAAIFDQFRELFWYLYLYLEAHFYYFKSQSRRLKTCPWNCYDTKLMIFEVVFVYLICPKLKILIWPQSFFVVWTYNCFLMICCQNILLMDQWFVFDWMFIAAQFYSHFSKQQYWLMSQYFMSRSFNSNSYDFWSWLLVGLME